MALELIAVNGCTLAATGITGATFAISTVPSIYTKIDNSGVYAGGIAFSFTGGTGGSASPGTVSGGGTIPPTALYTKDDGLLIVREGDDVDITATGTNPSPPPATVDVPTTVSVSVAGQTSTKAE